MLINSVINNETIRKEQIIEEYKTSKIMNSKIKKTIIIVIILSILLSLIFWTAWGNKALELNNLTISSKRLPKAFDGYRIAHISDLHNAEFGIDNARLINMIKDAKPDIIAITGDLIDSRNTDINIALKFAKEAMKIAPCYYVTGNHEARVSQYNELKEGLKNQGVIVLEDEFIDIEYAEEKITLFGINDPSFQTDYLSDDTETVIKNKLHKLIKPKNNFTVLLSHRPELFEVYVDNDIDLVLSGHAHGGQFRLPFIGGVVAPNQGLFPKYDAGLYVQENTNMVVSKGIGNSILPFRFNNRPEVILIELQSEKA